MQIWLSPSAFYPARGGVEELTFKLASALQKHGHEVLVITNRWPAELLPNERVGSVEVRRFTFSLPGARPGAARRYLVARKRLQRELHALPTPSVIHIQCASSQLPAMATYGRRHGVPLVITTQGEVVMDAHHLYQRSAFMRWALRREAERAAALTACSHWSVRATVKVAPAFARAEVVLNGVDPHDWGVSALPAEAVLCAWGRHVPQKGFDLLLKAFPRVRADVPEATLLIGGDGPETARLRQLATTGVQFLGSLDRQGVGAMLERARVGIVPSRLEPFGIVAVEVLAAGRGLVYAAGTGLEEAAGGLGRPVNVMDPRAFADAIVAELLSPTSSRDGQARAQALSWDTLTDRYTSIYRRIASGPLSDANA